MLILNFHQLVFKNNMIMSQQEIELQVQKTEERGQRIVDYLDMYKGTNLYNEIVLAIEFGYQLRMEEEN